MLSNRPIRTVLVGCGIWGSNLLREIAHSPEAELAFVVDPSEAAKARAKALVPDVTVLPSLEDIPNLGIDAVVIASPPELHREHALFAIRAGAHVFVEKPLTTCGRAAEELLREALRHRRIAMVGHLMRYHPGIEKMLALVHGGALGRVLYGSSVRLSARRSEGSVVWALAPHDLSLFRAVTHAPLSYAEIEWLGGEAASLRVESETGLSCHVTLSRGSSQRERRFTVVCERGSLFFDDGGERPTLSLLEGGKPPPEKGSLDAYLQERRHHIRELAFDSQQPLARELAHFFSCIRTGRTPRTAFDEGAEVVRILDRALSQMSPRRNSFAKSSMSRPLDRSEGDV